MFVRLVTCKFSPESIEVVRKIYQREIVPVLKSQKGIVGVRLLEPVDKSEDYISVSEWRTRADAEAYEKSGLFQKLIAKLESYFTKQPVVKTYTAEEVLAPVEGEF